MQYITFWASVWILLGAVLYNIDRKYLIGVYRSFYNASHKTKLAPEIVRGFIYGRDAKSRVTLAFLISLGQTIYAFYHTAYNPTVELVMFFGNIPLIVIGFYCGPILTWVGGQLKGVYNYIDQLERGEVKPHHQLRDTVKGWIGGWKISGQEADPNLMTGAVTDTVVDDAFIKQVQAAAARIANAIQVDDEPPASPDPAQPPAASAEDGKSSLDMVDDPSVAQPADKPAEAPSTDPNADIDPQALIARFARGEHLIIGKPGDTTEKGNQ